MSKSVKLVLLTLVAFVSFLAAIITAMFAYRAPEYPQISSTKEVINEVTLEKEKIVVEVDDVSKPYINSVYIVAIHCECLIFGFALVYLILTNFCEKSFKEAFGKNSMIFCLGILSLSLMEFVSVIILLIVKYQMLLQIK